MTLFELLITILLIAILAAIGVPSYRYITTYSRMSAEMNALLGDLQYARSEAVREGEPVTVCIADGPSTLPACAPSGTTNWQQGWIVFVDPGSTQTYTSSDPLLRTQPAFTHGDIFTSDNDVNAITFNREGFAFTGYATVQFTLTDPSGTAQLMRCLFVTESGMMNTSLYASGSTCS